MADQQRLQIYESIGTLKTAASALSYGRVASAKLLVGLAVRDLIDVEEELRKRHEQMKELGLA